MKGVDKKLPFVPYEIKKMKNEPQIATARDSIGEGNTIKCVLLIKIIFGGRRDGI